MLSSTERGLAAAVTLVLVSGLTAAASTAEEPSGPTSTAAVPPAPQKVAPPAPTAVPPVTAAPRPAPTAVGPVGTRVLGPVPPAPPQQGCPAPPLRPGAGTPGTRRVPAVAEAALPAAVAPGPKATSLRPVAGKGIWTTNFEGDRLDVAALVARAKAAGLRNVWVRTGGRTGYYGDAVLPELVPTAHAAGLTVVAWDFPYLSDPVADARRAQQAFADGADAFAPDVETAAEGTFATDRRVRLYLSLVRRHAGTRPVAATVPRPTPKRLASFPYDAFAPYADLFVPMVYWSCNEPGRLVVQSLQRLGRLLPVAPVGQAYDMGSEGGRAGLPSREETLRFLDVAKRGGAVGASLWTFEQTGDAQWAALHDYAWER